MKKILLLLSFILLLFLSKTSSAQIIDTPIVHDLTPRIYKTFAIQGRVIGVNLEDVAGVTITNKRTAGKITTNSHGIYEVNAAKGDTLFFEVSKYSKVMEVIRNPKERLNIILIKKKTDELPANHSSSDYNKANRADDELLRILEKDAKLEGKWNY
jgi:hypothetical protein